MPPDPRFERALGGREEFPMSAFYLLPDGPNKPETWRKKALYGQKPPLKPREVWAIRTRLQIQGKRRDPVMLRTPINGES